MTSATTASHSILSLVGQSGLVVQFVLLLLVTASILSWTIILMKWRSIQTSIRWNTDFLNLFWNGKNLDEVADKLDQFKLSPVSSVFRSGYRELQKIPAAPGASDWQGAVDNVARALSRASGEEVYSLEKHVSWLATIASAAPFVGLFGTVWGIMNAFQKIGSTGSANLAVVAPGISEALIATAVGLAAAIPAVVAYNYFAGQIRRIASEIDGFSQDFLNLIQRSLLTARKEE